ncbi:MAG: hypothetical protein H6Q97_992 [Nitrospirae bacterium]|nr:hypothetical protein [Nitrospirota bacterium]
MSPGSQPAHLRLFEIPARQLLIYICPGKTLPGRPVISLLDHIRYELGGTLVAQIAQALMITSWDRGGLHAAEQRRRACKVKVAGLGQLKDRPLRLLVAKVNMQAVSACVRNPGRTSRSTRHPSRSSPRRRPGQPLPWTWQCDGHRGFRIPHRQAVPCP